MVDEVKAVVYLTDDAMTRLISNGEQKIRLRLSNGESQIISLRLTNPKRWKDVDAGTAILDFFNDFGNKAKN